MYLESRQRSPLWMPGLPLGALSSWLGNHREACAHMFSVALPMFSPHWAARPSVFTAPGKGNHQRGDNIRVIFLAFESQIPGFRHKPDWEIYMDGWETLSLGLIRLFRSGSWRSWEADLMVGSLGRSPGGLPLPCSPASPRRGEM